MTRNLPAILDPTQSVLQKIEEMLAPDEHRMLTGMNYGQETKYVEWHIPEELGEIELLQITDVQFGHVECKYDRVVEYRDWVLSKPNRFMLWTGDMVDAWALWSPGRAFEQIGDPQSQVFKFCEVWAPARHRILGSVGGNHERRAIPGFGDLGILIASLLRIPYSGGRQLVDIHFGKHKPFKISLWHGVGGARTKGTVAQTLQRFAQKGDSQLYLMGHLHQPMIIPFWKEQRQERSVTLQKSFGAVGSSFLNTWGTYGEISGFDASDVMMAKATLEANGKWAVVLR